MTTKLERLSHTIDSRFIFGISSRSFSLTLGIDHTMIQTPIYFHGHYFLIQSYCHWICRADSAAVVIVREQKCRSVI